jgi:hypothetical protein
MGVHKRGIKGSLLFVFVIIISILIFIFFFSDGGLPSGLSHCVCPLKPLFF